MRNRAGITERSPAGMDEVIYSNVTKPEYRRVRGLGRGRVPARGYAGILPENARDNQEFSREQTKRDHSDFKKKSVPGKKIATFLKI